MNNIAPSVLIIREAVSSAIKTGRSWHDFWYYTMTPQQQALFGSKLNFETRCEAAYKAELTKQEQIDSQRSSAVEAYWQTKQGEEYGSY